MVQQQKKWLFNSLYLILGLAFYSCSYNKIELPVPVPVPINDTTITNGPVKYSVNLLSGAFSPSSLVISVGDTVEWTNPSGFHNVNGTIATFPSNPEGFGNNVSNSWNFSYVFNTAGNYNYQCDVHASSGMTGTITVQ